MTSPENLLSEGMTRMTSPETLLSDGMTRRDILRGGLAGVAVLGAGGVLAACGGGSSTSTSGTAASGTPKHGGTLRLGLTGGATTDTIDPIEPVNVPDYARLASLYDPLVTYNRNALPELQLAEEIRPNKTATEWTIRVKEGVQFHNGKELTADDVKFTLERIQNPKHPGEGVAGIKPLNVGAAKKMDKYTLRIPTTRPYSILEPVLAGWNYNIVPVDYNPSNPVGTGPFKYKSFKAGQQSTFVRNDNYWINGLPYVDTLVITDYSEASSQSSAFQAGQVDMINNLTADQIPVLESAGKKILNSPSGGWIPFTMNASQDPWKDNRVREAMRLIVNRKQMLDVVYGGSGTIGNDVFGIWDPQYDNTLPQREQDIEKAKSLLRAAGQENLTVTMVTGEFANGSLKMAQVLAQQASEAGVTVNLKNTNPATIFGPNWLKWNFTQDYWYYYTYLVQAGIVLAPGAPLNETNFHNAKYNKLYGQAISTTDNNLQTELAHELQMIDYNEGAYVIPNFYPIIDAYAPNVNGLVTSKNGISFNDYDLKTVWLS